MFKQNTNIESMLIIVNNPVSCNKLYSFSPQPGDTATVIVKDNNISINILLEQKIDDIWIGSLLAMKMILKEYLLPSVFIKLGSMKNSFRIMV